MIPAIDHEAGRPGDVHPLVEPRAAGQPPERQEQIGRQDQPRPGPAGELDEDQFQAQAASLLST